MVIYSPTDVLPLFWFSSYRTSPFQPLRNLTFNRTWTDILVVMILLTLAVRRNDVAVLCALPSLCWCCRDALAPRMHAEDVAFNTWRRKTKFRCLELDAQLLFSVFCMVFATVLFMGILTKVSHRVYYLCYYQCVYFGIWIL